MLAEMNDVLTHGADAATADVMYAMYGSALQLPLVRDRVARNVVDRKGCGTGLLRCAPVSGRPLRDRAG